LTAIALDKAGHVLPNVNFSYIPLTPGYFTISQVSPGVVTLTGVSEGTTWLSVSANGKSDGAGAFITVDPEHH
jgi:hypothetical protein